MVCLFHVYQIWSAVTCTQVIGMAYITLGKQIFENVLSQHEIDRKSVV